MSSCSGSVRSFHDEDESTPLNEKLDSFDADTASECSEAWSYHQKEKRSIRRYRPSLNPLAKCIHISGWLLHAILPSFVHNLWQKEHSAIPTKLHPTAHLDGMRGLAAFAVFLCHLSYSTFDVGHVWRAGETAEEVEDNNSLLQLPIVRLFYSGPPMVAIFFVISGYALSYKPLKQMRNKEYAGLLSTLSSSIFRRALRLFLPCFASTLLIICFTRLGWYKMTEDFANDVRAVHEVHYWTAPTLTAQLQDWSRKMINSINVFDWSLYAGSHDIDPHLWTIPVEFRCSMALFATHLLVARMSSRLRLSTLAFLLVWGTYWDRWEMVPFWAGITLAELDLSTIEKEDPQSLICEKDNTCKRVRSGWRTTVFVYVFVAGLYLASYPDADGHASPGYVWLTDMIPETYTEKHRFWGNIGAILIVWSVSNLYYIKRILNSSLMQYLGKISFPLYVCHGMVIHTFTYMSLDYLWELTDAYRDWTLFVRTFMLVAAATIVVTVWVADIFLRVVDVRCVKFARWLEKQLFVQ